MDGAHVSNVGAITINSLPFFLTCSFGGAISCGTTHFLVTPLDLVKCRKQVNPSLYSSILNGWSKIYKAEGLKGLWKGATPTAVGYSMQGACKFGLYEYFKYFYSGLVGQQRADNNKTLLYLSASASAEIVADVALCPMEALKVRMQTSSSNAFNKGSISGFKHILKSEGLSGFYSGLTPLWLRQVPYTMMKFAAFERSVEAIYKYALSKPKDQYNKAQQLAVSFAGGYWAGIFCAIVSHPADTVVSKLNNIKRPQGQSVATTISKIVKDLGYRGIWTGLGPRIVMIGTLTALQWFIYDTFKVYAGLPTSGSSNNSHTKK